MQCFEFAHGVCHPVCNRLASRVLEPGDDGRHDVEVKMTLTAPGCGMGDVLTEDVRHKLEKLPDVGRARVEMVFDPPWNQDMMSDAASPVAAPIECSGTAHLAQPVVSVSGRRSPADSRT